MTTRRTPVLARDRGSLRLVLADENDGTSLSLDCLDLPGLVGCARTLTKMLQGVQDDERLFAIIYSIDDTDDPWEEPTWIKANPAWGVSVQPDAIRAIMRQARNNPAQEASARTRHLNVWIGADEQLFSTRQWTLCGS